MKYGIFYAYWEREWKEADYQKYVQKVKNLGFDILEIQCAGLLEIPADTIRELAKTAEGCGIELTAGYGPGPHQNLASADEKIVQNAFEFWKKIFDVFALLKITKVGGGLYSYWPVDYQKPFHKNEDLKRSIERIRELADIAQGYNIVLGMEVLNRFEGYLLNTAKEAVSYVKAVDRDNVKIMLDTFHMNIEEDSITGAIQTAGSLLGHIHLGEANRKPPRAGTRMDWTAIGSALHGIGYTGAAVMEPFVLKGGQIGNDIKVWRDLAPDSQAQLDEEAQKSIAFIRKTFQAAGN